MKTALIIGYGSIGKLHCKILAEMGFKLRIVSGHENSGDEFFPDIETGCAPYLDYAVIASSTILHQRQLETLLKCGYAGKVTVEKPLFAQPEMDKDYPADLIYVGYNLRFHPGLIALREALTGRKVLTVQHYVGQHLSQWRTGADHLKSYSAHSTQGGGVLRDLSHELDLMQHLFGKADRMSSLGGRFGNVTVDSEDAFGIVMRAERCPLITLQMNYLDWHGGRQMKVVCEDTSIDLDFTRGTLRVGNEVQNFDFDRETSYRSMHHDILSDHPADACTYAEAADILKQIETLENQ